jgi:uncharacterized protein
MGAGDPENGHHLGLNGMSLTASPEREYFDHLAQGRFMLQRSRGSGEYVFYPRVAAPRTGATDLEWVEVSGRATVYSATFVRQKPPAADYNVVLVELEEGPRMISRVDGMDRVPIGLRVRARIVQEDGGPAVVFVPDQQEAPR